MPKIWITEYAASGSDSNGLPMLIATYPPKAVQTPVEIGLTSVQSAAFAVGTRFVRVRSDAACHIAIGDNPTATTNHTPLDANAAEYFGVSQSHKLAVIATV